MSPIVNVIRRVCIFLVFLGLVVNGVCLVMANQASTTRTEQTEASFKLHARFKDKAKADEMASSLKKDKADMAPRTTVTATKSNDEVPTGKFYVGLVLDSESADPVGRTVKNGGYNIVMEPTEGDRKLVRLVTVYNSKGEAESQAKAVSAKLGGLVNMSVIEARRKVAATTYVLEVVVADEASLEAVKQYVEAKAPAATSE